MNHPYHAEPLVVVPASPDQEGGGAEAEFETMPTEVDPPFRAEPPPSSELEPPGR